MSNNDCPTPTKRLRVLLSLSDGEESDELNLSSSFDQTYQTLMKDEIVTICLKQENSTENLNEENDLSEFKRKCDDFLSWVARSWSQSKWQPLCRSDYYLERIIQGRQMLQTPRFTNIKTLGNTIISAEPHLNTFVSRQIESLEKECHFHDVFNDLTLPNVLEEINEDIHDLSLWLSDIRLKLNLDLTPSNKKTNLDFIEFVLRDLDVHNKIGISIIKLISELQEIAPLSLHEDSSKMIKSAIDSVENTLYQLWLKTLEYKLILEEDPRQSYNKLHPGYLGVIGQESGFESELSPRNNIRKLSTIKVIMNDISSGDNTSDHTTDFPLESETATISMDKRSISSSSLFSSTEIMPQICEMEVITKEEVSSKRILRRKKRRSRRPDCISQCNVSTEESDAGKTVVKSVLKRRIKEVSNSQLSEVVPCSLQGLNYAEIADAAEKLLRKNTLPENSPLESPKESEVEDIIEISKSHVNEIDLDRTWDYYQAEMYSNEEGDSQIVEIANIKEWEPETDTEDVDVLITANSSPKIAEHRLSMLTSGYETSMDADPTICSKSIICVLQFSTMHYHEVEDKLSDIQLNLANETSYSYEELMRTLKECHCTSLIHLKLICQILNFEPCYVSHNTTLLENLQVMESRWSRVKNTSVANQLSLLESHLKKMDYYRNIDDLRSSMACLIEVATTFYDIKKNFNVDFEDKDKSWVVIERIEEVLLKLKRSKSEQLEVILQCRACVTESKCTRKLFNCELQLSKDEVSGMNVNVQEVYTKFETCILSLKTCMQSLEHVSSTECRIQLSTTIDREISLWQVLCDKATFNSPLPDITPEEIKTLQDSHSLTSEQQPRSRLLRNLPMHVAIVVVVAMLGWWYNQSSMSDCRSSSTNWIQLFHKFKKQLEPH